MLNNFIVKEFFPPTGLCQNKSTGVTVLAQVRSTQPSTVFYNSNPTLFKESKQAWPLFASLSPFYSQTKPSQPSGLGVLEFSPFSICLLSEFVHSPSKCTGTASADTISHTHKS